MQRLPRATARRWQPSKLPRASVLLLWTPSFFALAQRRPHPGTCLGSMSEKVRSYDPDADEGLINRAYVFP